MSRKRPEDLRSHRWLGVNDLRAFGHRSRLRQFGYDADDWAGRPVIGIINTWSEINACHAHLRSRAGDVKRGVLQAGGFPIELPAMSLAEPFVKPSTMLYRNFLAMEAEELLRSHPLDGAVLLGGCDKTTPGLIMGAISMCIPAIYVPAGPMLRGNWRGQYLGSGSDVWKYWTEKRAGIITEEQWNEMESGIARSFGTCMVMGTAATMMAFAVALGMERFDRVVSEVPVLANVRPSGKYLMEDFFYAGGLRALMMELKERLDLSCVTVTGKTVGENIAGAEVYLRDVIHSLAEPVYAEGATAVLTGNLAPRGCVMKPAAADQRFLKHRGPALAFEDYNHMAREIERDDLAATPDHVIVLKNAGPKGGPGMPEWGMLPIPKKLVQAGVRDMVRISDGRMSGTSYGACILHVSPESFVGGPLALVKTGDAIEVDVPARRIHLDVAEEELNRRRAAWKQPAPRYARGYGAMFSAHIGQADEGCDFDFLAGKGQIPEPEIH